MPIQYTIIESKKLVYAVGSGVLTLPDLLRHIEELAADPRYKAPMKKIVDYRNAIMQKLTMKEADIFTHKKASLKKTFLREKCAIVTNKDVDFGMSRAHGAKIEGEDIDTRIFRDMNKALDWLDIQVENDELLIKN